MRKYPKYKPSYIEWIGDIPEHWEVEKLRYIGNFTSSGIDKKINEDEPLVKIINYTDVYGNATRLLTSERNYMEVSCPEEKRNEHQVIRGDLIFTPSSETIEDIGLSALVDEKLENTAYSYHVLRFRFDREVDHSFKKYLCNNYFILNQFSANAKGTTRKILNRENFNSALVILPPKTEQTAIANLLDEKTTKIDTLITNKQKLIKLLKKERTAIINHAVTNGITPNVKLKPSGIELLGNIPKNWVVKKFTFFTPIITCGLASTPEYVNEGIPFLSAQNVKNNKLVLDKYNFISEKLHKELTKNKKPIYGDILVTRVGAGIGDACIVDVDFEFSIYVSLTHIRVDENQAFNKFIMYFFSTDYCKTLNTLGTVTGGGVGNLNVNNVKMYRIPLPSLKEQEEIVCYIETETKKINGTIAKIEKEIELLQEYRTALISEVVTGKIKVI